MYNVYRMKKIYEKGNKLFDQEGKIKPLKDMTKEEKKDFLCMCRNRPQPFYSKYKRDDNGMLVKKDVFQLTPNIERG